jgi:hypothetical protein
LSPAQEEPTFTPARSPPAPSSSPCPPVSKAVRSPQVLSINTLSLEPSQSPPSPSFLPDKPVSLTDRELLELVNKPVSIYCELLELLNLPENLDSIKLLAEYGLVPDDTLLELGLVPNHTLLEPSPLPPLSPIVPSSPPYVPLQLRTAPAAHSAPSYVPRQAPASSAAPRQAPASPAPASSLGPPFVSYIKIEKGCFYFHNKYPSGLRHTHRNHCPWFHHLITVGTCYLNDRGELCLGPKRH